MIEDRNPLVATGLDVVGRMLSHPEGSSSGETRIPDTRMMISPAV
jgi:hypothetical protein